MITDIHVTCNKSGFALAEETKYTWVTKGLSTCCQRSTPKCTFMVVLSDGKVILTESSFTCTYGKLFTVGSNIMQVRL